MTKARTDPSTDIGQADAPMVWLPGGTFRMGSDHHYTEEKPAHEVTVSGFWIDPTPVTNRQFARFVAETGHVTFAEIPPRAEDYPGALPHMLRAASLVFTPPGRPVDLRDWSQWWVFKPGATWRRPLGPGSSIKRLDDHPVVHVAWPDVEAYAAWAGKQIPTEAEWEYAAWGGVTGKEFAWGDEFMPGGKSMARTFQGNFPNRNSRADGFERTSPVGSYPANGFGLYDMIGNVWEWTQDWYAARHETGSDKPCCGSENARAAAMEASHDPRQPEIRIPRKTLKGGSHLCAPSYCRRYRPAARHAQSIDSSMSHLGFRCIRRPD